MDRILQPSKNQISNVGLGLTWSSDFQIGPAYRYVDILVTFTTGAGLTASSITDFIDLTTINVNSKPFRTFLGTEANSIYTFFGSNYGAQIFQSSGSGNALVPVMNGTALHAPIANAQTTCHLRIYFEEPWRKSWAAASSRKFFTSWPAAKAGQSGQVLSSFQISSLIPNTANNAGATNVSVIIYTGTDASKGVLDASGNPVTTNLKWYRYPGFSYTAAGDQSLNNLVKIDKGRQLAILEQFSIFSQKTAGTADQVNRLQVFADSRLVYDTTNTENLIELLRHGFNPSYDLTQFHYVPDANDVIMDGLVLSTPNGAYVNSLAMTPTLATAASDNKTLVTISQVVGPLD